MGSTSRRSSFLLKSLVVIATVAFLAMPSRVTADSDPQRVFASPMMTPGADLTVLKNMIATARYAQAVKMSTYVNTMKAPNSFSSCISGILGNSQKLTNMFESDLITKPSLAALKPLMVTIGKQCAQQLEQEIDNGLGEDTNGPHTVQNGIIVQTSLTNLMGSTGGNPVLSIPQISSSLISNPVAAALVAQTATIALQSYQQALAEQAAAQQAQAQADAANTAAQNAATANPTAANQAAASSALAQKQAADAALLSAASAASAASASSAQASAAASGGASLGDSNTDNIDFASLSGGVTLTAKAIMPSGLLPDPENVTSPTTDDGPPPGIPLPPVPVTYDNPAEAPQNATICISPSNRSDLDYADATEDSDAVASAFWNAAQNGLGNATGSLQDATNQQTVPAQRNNPILPQPNSPNPGDKPSGANSQIPSSIDGVPGCSPFTISKSSPGVTSSGMPCTTNTKAACMAGSGCSPQNGLPPNASAKDYTSGTIFTHGTYGNGQCAALSQGLVPNLGASQFWRRGPHVYLNAKLQFGTIIATFFGPAQNAGASEYGQAAPRTAYRYEPHGKNGGGKLDHMQHTGAFMGYTTGPNGLLFLVEQYANTANGGINPHINPMPWGHEWNGVTPLTKNDEMHNALNYYVVCTVQHPC